MQRQGSMYSPWTSMYTAVSCLCAWMCVRAGEEATEQIRVVLESQIKYEIRTVFYGFRDFLKGLEWEFCG